MIQKTTVRVFGQKNAHEHFSKFDAVCKCFLFIIILLFKCLRQAHTRALSLGPADYQKTHTYYFQTRWHAANDIVHKANVGSQGP